MKKKKKGFTLIELVAVIAMAGILGSILFTFFISASSMMTSADNDAELQNESRTIMDLLEDDIKYGSKIKINDAEPSSVAGENLKFERGTEGTPPRKPIYEYKTNSNKEFKKLKDGAELSNISKNVEKFEIKYLNTGVYEIYLKLSKNKSEYEYRSSIYPMNSKPNP